MFHAPLSQTAEIQSQNLMTYLQTCHPSLNDVAYTRRLVTTQNKPTTKDYYKLLSEETNYKGLLQATLWSWVEMAAMQMGMYSNGAKPA
jgi:hypothetical protein